MDKTMKEIVVQSHKS